MSAPIINPTPLFARRGGAGATMAGALGKVMLESISRNSTPVSDGMPGCGCAAFTGCGLTSTEAGGLVAEEPAGTEVADASSPITVGAFTSEFVGCERDSAIVSANSLFDGDVAGTGFVFKPALSSLASTAAVDCRSARSLAVAR